MQCLVRFKCVSKNTDQEGKKTVYSFKAERIGPHPTPPTPPTHTKKICAYEGKSDGKRGRRTARQREREKKPPLLALLPARSSFIT